MKYLILTATIISFKAQALPQDYYLKDGKELSKIEAMFELIKTKNDALVHRCRQVELSGKGTIKYKKQNSKAK